MGKSYNEILNKLKELNAIESNEVKTNIDSMKMKFSDWAVFTNRNFSRLDERDFESQQRRIFLDKIDITYSEYQQMCSECEKYAGIMERSDNEEITKLKVKIAKENGEEIDISEDKIAQIEEIAEQWKQVKEKYDGTKGKDLNEMSLEELVNLARKNDETINKNNENIKQALISKIVLQQKHIKEQEEKINSLQDTKEK